MGKKFAKLFYWKKTEKVTTIPEILWDIEVQVITPDPQVYRTIKFGDLRDEDTKAFLIINVSDACNLTGIVFRQLNKLHKELKPKGLKIIALPSVQYDYKRSKKLRKLGMKACGVSVEEALRNKFKVDYTVLKSDIINGEQCCDLYKYLRANCSYFNPLLNKKSSKAQSSKTNNQILTLKQIPYNFAKFILDKDGNVVKFYEPADLPSGTKPFLEKMLKTA